MYRRLYKVKLWALVLGLTCTACAQMPHHSNTLVFATNTTFGISAGQEVANIPTISVGYKRQEAVIMPLVANTQSTGTTLEPCEIDQSAPSSSCLLKGVNGAASDSYSVLASFGAKFDGSGGSGSANGGLAQYFATGIAAQLLAVRGGAALVATGDAVTEEAKKPVPTSAIAAVFGDPAINEKAEAGRAITVHNRSILAKYLAEQTTNSTYRNELGLIESAIGDPGRLTKTTCLAATLSECLGIIESGSMDAVDQDRLSKAIADRKTARGLPQ